MIYIFCPLIYFPTCFIHEWWKNNYGFISESVENNHSKIKTPEVIILRRKQTNLLCAILNAVTKTILLPHKFRQKNFMSSILIKKTFLNCHQFTKLRRGLRMTVQQTEVNHSECPHLQTQ